MTGERPPIDSERPRLQKVIGHSGLCSRRAAEELIRSGRVAVNGAIAHLGQRVDVSCDRIEVDGVRLPVRPDLVYYLVNKPVGYVSTADDSHGRPTVVSIVPSTPRVYPVGRLDLDSGGLMVLSNDGDLTERVTHPRYGVHKTYSVLVRGRPVSSTLRKLVSGVDLDDGPAVALSVRILAQEKESTVLEVVMGEGRNREVRRLLDAVGHPVKTLFRTAVGPVTDRNLRSGTWRHLTLEEVRALYGGGT